MAQVTGVNHETKTVTVEWSEGEEIKGKEVCLVEIQINLMFLNL